MTFVPVLPPSRVTWIRPSSVPAQMRLASCERRREGINDAAMFALRADRPRCMLAIFGGTPGSSRVRSGLMICQLWPPSVVLKERSSRR